MTSPDGGEVAFVGAGGQRLAGMRFGDRGRPVLLLHGAGQTRHAWTRTAIALAASGFQAFAIDQRGHGDSEWVPDGAYAFEDFGKDAVVLARAVRAMAGRRPVLVGASLGGIAGLLADREAGSGLFDALVLVDVTPSLALAGLMKIRDFMEARVEHGFASVEDAAEAVALYQPGRPRPDGSHGLMRNLRPRPDGRLRWHWDPQVIRGARNVMSGGEPAAELLRQAASALRIPTLLVKGARSDLVTGAEVAEFRRLVPHAGLVDIADAGHMVAGDRNDVFAGAILDFLLGLDGDATER